MTFAEYNTDDNFDKKESSLDELVKLGLAEGKTSDEIKSSLSPKWQNSKKIGEFDNYVKQYSTPKAEAPKEEVKETVTETATIPPKVETETTPAKKENISKGDKKFLNEQVGISDYAAEEELKKQREAELQGWKDIGTTVENSQKAFKKIDDHLVENLPTFAVQRYKNGEFGEPGSKDAKLRLAHFMISGLQSTLKTASNAFAANAGRSPVFADTTSDYEKYQQTNLAQGLENRWAKNKADTEAASKLAAQQGVEEQAIKNSLRKISTNANMQTAFNMMNENQKAYAIKVISEIGDKIKDFNRKDVTNFLIGALVSDKNFNNDDLLAAMGVKFGTDILDSDAAKNVIDKIKDLVGSEDTEGSEDIVAGVGGSGNDYDPDVVDKGKTNNFVKNPTGNLKGYKALDGNTYDFETFESKEGKQRLANLINDLDNRFYNGEINAETYRKYRQPLYDETKKHRYINATDTEQALKDNVYKKMKDLNDETLDHKVTVDNYKARTNKILEMANDAAMSDKEIESLKKQFIKESKIKYKEPKK